MLWDRLFGTVMQGLPLIERLNILYNMKLLRLHGKLLFRHKTFAIAHDGPKDYACDRDH